MAQVIALFRPPVDRSAFDAYFFSRHVPLAKAVPGLKSYRVSIGQVAGVPGDSGVYRVAVLEFASLASMQAAMASPQGLAAARDLAQFADGGVDLLMFDSQPI